MKYELGEREIKEAIADWLVKNKNINASNIKLVSRGCKNITLGKSKNSHKDIKYHSDFVVAKIED